MLASHPVGCGPARLNRHLGRQADNGVLFCALNNSYLEGRQAIKKANFNAVISVCKSRTVQGTLLSSYL